MWPCGPNDRVESRSRAKQSAMERLGEVRVRQHVPMKMHFHTDIHVFGYIPIYIERQVIVYDFHDMSMIVNVCVCVSFFVYVHFPYTVRVDLFAVHFVELSICVF